MYSFSKSGNNSSIVFEFVDSNGVVVFSELSDIEDLSGAATAYIWIKKDPLGTYDEIADGSLTLYIAGELDGVPDRYRNRRNLRSSFTFDVRKDFFFTICLKFRLNTKRDFGSTYF